MVRREESISDPIQSIFSYAQVYEKSSTRRFVYIPVLDVFSDMVSFNFLAMSLKFTHTGYIYAVKSMIQNEGDLPLIVTLPMDTPVVKTLGMTYFEDADG